MKVALDISKFAQGQFENSGKTGVYRYTANLLEQMLIRKEVDLFLSFLKFPHAMEESRVYLKNKGYDAQYIFKNSNLENWIYGTLKKHSSMPYNFWLSLIIATAFQLLRTKSLPQSYDVFHSSYFPIPGFISSSNTIRFITIHDIIFLLYPAFLLLHKGGVAKYFQLTR